MGIEQNHRMRTVGVDLAAGAARTALCIVDWEGGRGEASYVVQGLEDDDLLVRMDTADWIGIDVPLGWPDPFVEAVTAHRANLGWPGVSGYPIGDRRPYCYRRTDFWIRSELDGAVRPLSVAADKLGATAMRAALLLARFNDECRPIDRIGARGGLVEVYPAAALARWGLPYRGYKGGTAGRPGRASILRLLSDACPTLSFDAISDRLLATDDALDALVAALVARAAAIGATSAPPEDLVEVARREGWIHLPDERAIEKLA